jgi:hypothetical protein
MVPEKSSNDNTSLSSTIETANEIKKLRIPQNFVEQVRTFKESVQEFPAPGPVDLPKVDTPPPDPDDLAGLLADPEDGQGVKTKVAITTCKIKLKPPRDSFFRVHLTAAYPTNIYSDTTSFGTVYCVDNAVVPAFPGQVKRVTLFLCVTPQGEPFFWAVRSSDARGRIDDWASGDYEAAVLGREHWVRVYFLEGRASHKVEVAEDDLGDPNWPDLAPEDLLRLAVKENRVRDLDHPLVKRLKGKK